MAETPERKWTTLRRFPGHPSRESAAVPAPESGSVGEREEASSDPLPEIEGAGDAPVPPSISESPDEEPAVLVAHPFASTSRLIRETLDQFTGARVFTTTDPLRAFELSLQRSYRLFVFAMQLGEISGPMLYELISKACAAGRGPRLLAPGVVFVREKDDPRLPESLARDVRVKDVLSKPIRIERLLESVGGVLEVKDPTARN